MSINTHNHSAIISLNMITERERICVKEIRMQIKGDKDFDKFLSILDDPFLLHFVRGRNYDSIKAYLTLKNYIFIRTDKYLEMFIELRPSRLPILSNLIRVFKNRDTLGRIIGLMRIEFWDPDEISLNEMALNTLVYLEEAWNDLSTEQNGVILILDSTGFSLKQARQISPHQIQKLLDIFWNAFPMKHHQVHVLNSPFYFTSVFNVIKRFLPQKLRERIIMHGQSSSHLHKYLSPEIIPDIIGGYLPVDEAFDEDFGHRILKKEDYYRKFGQKLQ